MRRKGFLAISTAALLVASCAARPPAETLAPSSYAGWRAAITCSAVYVARRELRSVLEDELAGMPPKSYELPPPRVDRANDTVIQPYAEGEAPRLAAYRGDLGCTNLPVGATNATVVNLPRLAMPRASGKAAEIPWPDGDLMPVPPPAVADQAALDALLVAAFDGSTFGDGTKTIGLALVHNGKLVAEHYRTGFGPHVQYRTWSAAKSMTNALVGILVREGKLDVKAPAPIPEWQTPGDPRAKITIENLLHMSSGLQTEGAEAYSVYFDGGLVTDALARAQLEAEPGTRWHYANRDTLALMRAAREAIGDDKEYLAFPQRALLDKIGMRDTVPEVDAGGDYILSSQVWTTARDLARFGLLYLNDGVWNGERILPQGWVEYSITPAPARPTGIAAWWDYGIAGFLGYGAQFWLFDEVPFFPYEAYSAIGHRGQFVTVVPSHDLVIVRTGLDPEVGDVVWRQDEFITAVIEALGES